MVTLVVTLVQVATSLYSSTTKFSQLQIFDAVTLRSDDLKPNIIKHNGDTPVQYRRDGVRTNYDNIRHLSPAHSNISNLHSF